MKSRFLMFLALPALFSFACMDVSDDTDMLRGVPAEGGDDGADEPCVEDDCFRAIPVEEDPCPDGEIVGECVDQEGSCEWVEECVEPEPDPDPVPDPDPIPDPEPEPDPEAPCGQGPGSKH